MPGANDTGSLLIMMMTTTTTHPPTSKPRTPHTKNDACETNDVCSILGNSSFSNAMEKKKKESGWIGPPYQTKNRMASASAVLVGRERTTKRTTKRMVRYLPWSGDVGHRQCYCNCNCCVRTKIISEPVQQSLEDILVCVIATVNDYFINSQLLSTNE